MGNAEIIRHELLRLDFQVFGGINAPYVWVKTPNNMSSWNYFNELLFLKNIISTPGILFGKNGEGFVRFSGFANREIIIQALDRLKR